MKLLDYLLSIFLEKDEKHDVFSPQDLTDHYRKEIDEFSLDAVFTATHYGDISEVLEAYKYRSEREKSMIFLKYLESLPFFANVEDMSNLAIIPVPMHWSRYIIRGYNHICILALELAKKKRIPYKNVLSTSFSFRQSKLGKLERIKNRKEGFSIKKGAVLPREVILIDDVISTGATANTCAKLLKLRGVEKVYGIFLASNQ